MSGQPIDSVNLEVCKTCYMNNGNILNCPYLLNRNDNECEYFAEKYADDGEK